MDCIERTTKAGFTIYNIGKFFNIAIIMIVDWKDKDMSLYVNNDEVFKISNGKTIKNKITK